MKVIEVQIPVTRFAVAYETGGARPYSGFERLLLQAIDGGASGLDELTSVFAVPSRLVVEGVVTLIQAGWVGLAPADNALLTTATGSAAVRSGEPPVTLQTKRPHPLHVVMERVSGAYCRNADVTLVPNSSLRTPNGESVIRLEPQIHDNQVDAGDVRSLLRVSPGEWVRWISPDSILVSKGSQSAIARYDVEAGRLTNVPDGFRRSLEPLLIGKFGPPKTAQSPQLELPVDVRRCKVQLGEDDLIVNAAAHDALLREALDSAQSHFVACSAFANPGVLMGLLPHLAAAVQRGVTVDLLWGYSGTDDAGVVEYVKKLQYDYRDAPGQLMCNAAPSGSHAKLLIWDSPDQSVNACIGSYNWLSAGAHSLGELSVRLNHPNLVADLARFVADRWAEIPGARLDVAQRRWHQLSSTWEQLGTEVGEPVAGTTASLVFGRGHEAALRRALVDPDPGRLIINSHRVADVGLRRLQAGIPVARSPVTGVVVAGELLPDVTESSIRATTEQLGLRYLQRPVHAKLLIHADTVLIGSYNFLSADPPSRGGRARELSIRLDGTDVRRLVETTLPEVWSMSVATDGQ